MFAYLDLHVGWKEILKRTVRDSREDDITGLAAELSYYFFLSLVPALLFLIALASLFPLQHLVDDVSGLLAPVAPPEVVKLVRDQMLLIADGDDTALLSFGLLGALWSSSAAMTAVVYAMDKAYDITEARAWWRVKLTAILLTIGLAAFLLIAATLTLAGPELVDVLTRWMAWPTVWAFVWKILQWPLVFLLVTTGIGLVYYFAPDAEQDWVWITPGSIVAAVIWLLSSLGLRLYLLNFTDYDATYGTLGGIMAMLLWFYLTGLAILIGAELNAEIEHASPWGKKAGEKSLAPGKRRRIGPAAARAHRKVAAN